MKDDLILRWTGILLVVTLFATSAIGQPDSRTFNTRSVDELRVDKVGERNLIEKNIPKEASVKPKKPRRPADF